MEPIFVREPNKRERDRLYELMEDKKAGYRAKIIILSYEGYTPPQIERAVNTHVKNVRKWIKRFNEFGINGILEKKRPGRKPKLSEKLVREIIGIASKPPHRLGLPFSTWSLRKLEGYLRRRGMGVSHTRIRQLLLKRGFRFWKSKQELISRDPEYEAKMARIRRLLKKPNCVVLYEDEKKVPLKLYAGWGWSKRRKSVPLNQKVKKVLVLFGVYCPHRNYRYFAYFEDLKSPSFVEFMKEVGRKFQEEDIYVILDSHRGHTSKYTKENLSGRIKRAFLPLNAPKLNRMEDEFSLFKREVLSNRRFGSEEELVVATKKWVNHRNRMGIALVNR